MVLALVGGLGCGRTSGVGGFTLVLEVTCGSIGISRLPATRPLGNSTIAMILLLVTAAVALNLVASAFSMQSFAYNTSQKTLQLALVWTVPFVGAIFWFSAFGLTTASSRCAILIVSMQDRGCQASVQKRTLVTIATFQKTAAATRGTCNDAEDTSQCGGQALVKSDPSMSVYTLIENSKRYKGSVCERYPSPRRDRVSV